MTSQEQDIATINSLVKIKIAPSKIHGVGVFAMRDIPAGTKLFGDMFPKPFQIPYSSFKKLFKEVKEYIETRWPRVVSSGTFMWPDVLWQAYMNHDDEPNYDCVKDITLKDIKKGEEIFEDYRRIENWETVHKWLLTKEKR